MQRIEFRLVLALLLIAAGVVFLLDSLGLLHIGALLWAAAFAVAGLIFLSVFFLDRQQWWALIPGLALVGLAILVALGELAPDLAGSWGAPLFLGGIGLAFWIIFLLNRDAWWAVIPGGVLWTVALVAGLSSVVAEELVGAVLFLGLGLTFGLLGLLRRPEGPMRWALIPAGVMIVLALVVAASASDVVGYLWPAALILAGLYLIARLLTARRSL